MKKLWTLLAVFGFAFALLAEEPSLHPLFKQAPRLLNWETETTVVSALSVRESKEPKDPVVNEAGLYLFYWGIDYYGRWVFGLIGETNYVLLSPVRLSFDGEEAFRVVPQSTERRTTKGWIKNFAPVSYLEHYTYFERTGEYDTEVKVPGAPWKVAKTRVLVRPHGEVYSQCSTPQGRVRTTVIVDWLEISPQRILSATTENGTFLGNFWGTQAFQIKETGIWVAFYELELPIAEYQQKTLFSWQFSSTLSLTADNKDKVVVYDIEWGWPPLSPCSITASSFANDWNMK